MRICFITEDLPPVQGGICELSVNLARAFHELGHSIRVVSANMSGSEAFDKKQPFPVERIGYKDARGAHLPLLRKIRASRRFDGDLARILDAMQASSKPDFAFIAQSSLWALPVRQKGLPYGVFIHGGDAFGIRSSPLRRMYRKRALQAVHDSARRIFTNSDFTRRMFAEVYGRSEGVVTAYCGVAPELLRELESLKEGESGRTNGKASMRGLILCRLVPVKACDVVLRAAGMLGEEGRRVELKIAGDGPERSRLESLARELRIDDRLEFLGYVGDVRAKARLLLESDFLIQSGRYDAQSKRVEHFGIVFAEAGAAGLPVIAPNIGGVPEVVRDGETGILIPPDDPESAAAAIRTLASDPGRTAAMGRAGRRRVAELFDYEKIAGKIIQEMSDAIRHDS